MAKTITVEHDIVAEQNATRRAKKAGQNQRARANASNGTRQEGFLDGLARDKREAAIAASQERHQARMTRIRELLEKESWMGTNEVTTMLMTEARDAFLETFDSAKPDDYVGSSRTRYASLTAEQTVWENHGDTALKMRNFVNDSLGMCRRAVAIASKEG